MLINRTTNLTRGKFSFRFAPVARALAGACLVGSMGATPACGQAQSASASLYQRVGGYDFIAKFVDTAFSRVAAQPQLRRLFQGHSTDSQLRQRQLIVDALCKEMGGPCIYLGRPMAPLHEGLHITESDWTEFMKIIGGALVELRVPDRERIEWVNLFDRKFRPAIVEGAK